MSDCIFCKIVAGDIPADIVHKGPNTLAFRDINPQAPVHVLIIPNRHIEHIRDAGAFSSDILTEMFDTANKVAEMEGIEQSGYRLMFNFGRDGGMEVYHLHLHLLGGRPLGPMVVRY